MIDDLLDEMFPQTEEEKLKWANLTKEEQKEILDSYRTDASNYSITSEIKDLFWKVEDRSVGIDLATLKFDYLYKMPELTEKFLTQFDDYLKSDKQWLLPDYEVVGTVVKPIVYEPFTCTFISSGKVILENDLREFFKENDFNVNSRKGTIQTIEDYAKQGMIHPFVGNSCPDFWINTAKDEIVVGTKFVESDDYTEETDMEGYTEWGYVCTDLWWYSLVDYEVFKRLSKLTDEEINTGYTVLDLDAGEWKLEHYYGITKNDHQDHPYGKLTKLK